MVRTSPFPGLEHHGKAGHPRAHRHFEPYITKHFEPTALPDNIEPSHHYVPGQVLARLIEAHAVEAGEHPDEFIHRAFANPKAVKRQYYRWHQGTRARVETADSICAELGHYIGNVWLGYLEESA